jgi:hypothetical protein
MGGRVESIDLETRKPVWGLRNEPHHTLEELAFD